jgi:hypothetical protein
MSFHFDFKDLLCFRILNVAVKAFAACIIVIQHGVTCSMATFKGWHVFLKTLAVNPHVTCSTQMYNSSANFFIQPTLVGNISIFTLIQALV